MDNIKYKIVYIFILLIVFFTNSCRKEREVLAVINQVKVYADQYEKMEKTYPDFEKNLLLEYLFSEILVIDLSDDLDIHISDQEIENNLNQIKSMDIQIYKKAIETYGNISKYKSAIKNNLIYDKVKNRILTDLLHNISLNSQSIAIDASKYIDDNQYTILNPNEIHGIEDTLYANYMDSLGNMLFERYKHHLIHSADIKTSKQMDIDSFISNLYLENVVAETLEANFETYAEEISYSELEYFYHAYFAFQQPCITKNYVIDSLQSIPLTDYRKKFLTINFVNMHDKSKKISLKFILDIQIESFSFSEEENININGLSGIMHRTDASSSQYTEKMIELLLYDDAFSSVIKIIATNHTPDEIRVFIENILRINHITN